MMRLSIKTKDMNLSGFKKHELPYIEGAPMPEEVVYGLTEPMQAKSAIKTADDLDSINYLAAGEDIAHLDIVYLKADGLWWKGSATTISVSEMIGIAMETKASGDFINIMLRGYVENSSWAWIIGQPIFLSITGGLTQTRPTDTDEVVAKVAWPVTPTRILFYPDNTRIELS